MKKITNKGFTLIELLVVIAIIAILALVVLLAINPVEMRRRANDSRRLADIGALRKAVDLALADGAQLPGTAAAPVTKTTAAAGALVANSTGNLVGFDVSKYLSVIAQDPVYATTGTTQTTSGACPGTAATTNKSDMVYTFKSNGSVYVISSHMESLDNCKATNDDGLANSLFETGTAPGLAL